jgi:hypothetical protein
MVADRAITIPDGEDVPKKVLKRDMTKGPHAPDTKIQKVIDRANHGKKVEHKEGGIHRMRHNGQLTKILVRRILYRSKVEMEY